jgi:hypothetical protein
MTLRGVILFFFVMLTGSAWAFLPPDASAREPQIRAHRQQVRDNHEKRLVERQAVAVRAYEQTRSDIFTPPWMRAAAQDALPSGGELSDVVRADEKSKQRNHRLLLSIMFLILIGAAVGWAHYATREVDKE